MRLASPRTLRALLPLLAAFTALALPALGSAATPPDGRYIVVLEPDANAARVAGQHDDRLGASVERVYGRVLNGYTARVPREQLDALRDDPRVAYVERDRPVHAIATQVNPPWGLDRIDQEALPLSGTYEYAASGAGVTAYVIDTGIRSSHHEFGGRVGAGFSVISDGHGTADCHGHGTHVAGTVGGVTYGVAKAVKLVPVRVLDCEGRGTTSGVIAGVEWVTAQLARPAVANMSLGGSASNALDSAVRSSLASGITYSLAAGNEGADACQGSPSRVTEGLTIAASSMVDAKPSWSNFGPCVDWFAPGVATASAYHLSDDAVATMSGTSMAAPHTAGAAALYLEGDPLANPAKVEEALSAVLTRGAISGAQTASNHLLRIPEPAEFAFPGDGSPSAGFEYSCAGLACQFDGTSSSDGDGSLASHAWSFGDGATATGPTTSHEFAAPGTYLVTLTVVDDAGSADTVARYVTVQLPAATPPPGDPATAAPEPPPAAASARRDVLSLAPTAYRVLVGRAHGGRVLSRLRREDALRFELSGRPRGAVTRSEFYAAARIGPARRERVRRLSLRVDAGVSVSNAALGLRLYHWSRHRFETIVAPQAGSTRERTMTWTTADPEPYLSADGEIRVAVGATGTGSHRTSTDRVRFLVR